MIFYEIKHTKTHVDVEVRKDGSVNVNINVGGMNPDASCYKHSIYVTAHLNCPVMQVALPHVFEALRHYYPYAEYCLELPYLPYARQDRRCNPGEAAGAKVFAAQINALGCKSVVITDPHSEVIAQLINGAQVAIFKEPKTDAKKKSAKGRLAVVSRDGKLELRDNLTQGMVEHRLNQLEVFRLNGEVKRKTSFDTIRERLA